MLLFYREKLMSNFNYDFIGINLRHLWSFKVSEDEKTALMGFGDNEGQLLQFDIEKNEFLKHIGRRVNIP